MSKRRGQNCDNLPSSHEPVLACERVLYILGYKWRVVFADGPFYTEAGLCYGQAEYAQQIITVSGDQTRELQRSTLIHEISHAIDKAHSNGIIDNREQCAQASEVGWFTILREPRNDWFFNFVREGYRDV